MSCALRGLVPLALAFSLAVAVHAGLPSEPVVRWSTTLDGGTAQPSGTPAVLRLADINGDGRVDESDPPTVAVPVWDATADHNAVVALDGATGDELWRHDLPPDLGWWGLSVAAADVDGDGEAELIASTPALLQVLDGDGNVEAEAPWPAPVEVSKLGQLVGVADLDQDGGVEIVRGPTVLSLDGGWDWTGAAGQAGAQSLKPTCVAELVDSSPGLELVAGNTLYAADGSILWESSEVVDGTCGVGDVTGDGEPEVVIAGPLEAWVLAADSGDALSEPITFPLESTAVIHPSGPMLAQLDGVGGLEFVIPAQTYLMAWTWNVDAPREIWRLAMDDGSCCAGASAVDLDGDGRFEVLHQDELRTAIVDGARGEVLWSRDAPSGTWFEIPVAVELDGDCEPEMLVVLTRPDGDGSVAAWDLPGSLPVRPAWNQPTYHVTNVDDAGTVPVVEAAPWEAGPGWLAQVEDPSTIPEGVWATLRVVKERDAVVAEWSLARTLLAGEHFHLLGAEGTPLAPFARINPEGDLSREHVLAEPSAPLVFLDLRVANACEQQSEDEFPPG